MGGGFLNLKFYFLHRIFYDFFLPYVALSPDYFSLTRWFALLLPLEEVPLFRKRCFGIKKTRLLWFWFSFFSWHFSLEFNCSIFFYKYWTLCSASSIYSKGQRKKEKLQLYKVLYNVIWENKSHYLRKGALLFLKWERRSGNKDSPPTYFFPTTRLM